MKLAIMQPYFFPYIGYWQLLHAVDRFVVYDDINYIKGGWVNRNRILINGKPSYITVPLCHASQFKRICDTDLQPSQVWREKMIKMIAMTYRRAPFFHEVFPMVEQLIRFQTNNLSEYLVNQLQILAAWFGITAQVVPTSRGYENTDLAGQNRILDICRQEGAATYVNPRGGMALYDQSAFEERGVELKFLSPVHVRYQQFGPVYVPWLSVIDLMMFNSNRQLSTLLAQYELA
jgi:hypothetical protein